MDLTTASPREIDEQLAVLYRREGQADQALAMAVNSMHHALNERKRHLTRNRSVWPTTDDQALAAVRAKVADPAYTEVPWGTSPAKALAKYEAAVAQLAAIHAEEAPLNAEYIRRGRWSRFFVVQANGGHVHSSMSCSTCNRNGSQTDFGWNPHLSGLAEAEAVAHLGPHATMLCTVCFPTAPLDWTCGPAATTDHCAGSGQRPDRDAGERRIGARWYGKCQTCARFEQLTTDSVLRKHKPAKDHA